MGSRGGVRLLHGHVPRARVLGFVGGCRSCVARDGSFVRGLLHSLQNDGELPPALALFAEARASLSAGFETPCRLDLLAGQDAPPVPEGELHLDTTRGWQRAASQAQAVDGFCQRALLRELVASSAALLESQAGPYSARVLSARPTSPTHFTRAALRRVALAWRNPPASCGACVQGATVATHVLVRDLNVVPSRQDERRIEVTANGLPLWAACNSPSTKPWCRP